MKNSWSEMSCNKYCCRPMHSRLTYECDEYEEHELRIDYDIDRDDFYYEHNLDDK